ncbi:DUF5953 family protein [Archangium lipolyticum]|uniref:DUF5953 family protein n=1 Tax=Archangium lipolyticum TaxID=2970465 RepID=UPI002149A146|nr:DUF5953 family protein [Archangium lipolyticum]
MSDAKDSLTLNVYAPSLMSHDERRLAIVHGMERAFPGLYLGWTMSKEEGLVSLPQRDEWVERERADGDFPFLCNDDDNHVVTLGGWEIPAGRYPGAQPQLQIHAMLPLENAVIAAAGGVLAGVAEGAQAVWGHITPGSVMLVIAEQMGPKMYGPPKPPRGLPALKLPDAIPAPEIPHCLGWLNYWSEAAARAIGFPDPARDAELLSRSRRTATDGWVVRLTEAPLDLDNPAHLDALTRAYERFPEIGGRSTP